MIVQLLRLHNLTIADSIVCVAKRAKQDHHCRQRSNKILNIFEAITGEGKKYLSSDNLLSNLKPISQEATLNQPVLRKAH